MSFQTMPFFSNPLIKTCLNTKPKAIKQANNINEHATLVCDPAEKQVCLAKERFTL